MIRTSYNVNQYKRKKTIKKQQQQKTSKQNSGKKS